MFYDDIKIFYDGINVTEFQYIDYIRGYTTNPTLMNKGKIESNNYKDFALEFLNNSGKLPVSFEVFADDLDEMISEAKQIYSWSDTIYVKIPITNSKGESTARVIEELNKCNIKVNVTAIFTIEQVDTAVNALKNNDSPAIISLFCGRIADTGINTKHICLHSYNLVKDRNIETLWASTREVYNVFDAINYKCDIITIPDGVLKKLKLISKNLKEFSLETVKMFRNDALNSGIQL